MRENRNLRIMLDTNVLLSIIIFKSKTLANMLCYICEQHRLVLASYVIDECHEVVARKKPQLLNALDRFLEALPYEYIYTPSTLPNHGWFKIRDIDDEKVLYSAISADVDVLITGDKDFSDISIEKPDILTPHAFCELYNLN